MRVDPYYRACFDGTMPLDWSEVQERSSLSAQQKAACGYLNDLGLAAVYVQDQVEIGPHLQLIGGLRYDHFDFRSTDRRS